MRADMYVMYTYDIAIGLFGLVGSFLAGANGNDM